MLPQFNFTLLVYQPNPQRGSIHYWVDGEPTRRFMKIDDFMELVTLRTPTCSRDAYESCRTYSFYLYNPADMNIIHLNPVSQRNEPYPDQVNAVVNNKQTKIKKENKTIEEMLVGYGFNMPSESSVQNLKVTLSQQEESPRRSMLRGLFDKIKLGKH